MACSRKYSCYILQDLHVSQEEREMVLYKNLEMRILRMAKCSNDKESVCSSSKALERRIEMVRSIEVNRKTVKT